MTLPDDPSDLPRGLPAEFVERYRIVRLLGAGAMGQVYEAVQQSLRRPVALKLMRPDAFKDLETASRFHEEARILAKLAHPNIVRLFDAGLAGDVPYLATELVDGVTLGRFLKEKTLDAADAIGLTMRLLDGLQYLHGNGVIHRDLKPDNIFVVGGNDVKVIDFGLAKALEHNVVLTQEGFAVGTPVFMAPDQILGKEPSPEWDIYAVGVVLFRALTGKFPFPCASTNELITYKLEKEPIALEACLPAAPAYLKRAVDRCLTLREAQRIRTCEELRAALAPGAPVASSKRVATPRPALPITKPIPAPIPPRAPSQGWRLAVGSTIVLAIVCAYGLGSRAETVKSGLPTHAPSSSVDAQAVSTATPAPPKPIATPAPEELLVAFRNGLHAAGIEKLRDDISNYPKRYADRRRTAELIESKLARFGYRPLLARLAPLMRTTGFSASVSNVSLQRAYDSARYLRRMDQFCAAIGIPFASGVEAIDGPGHKLGSGPALPPVSPGGTVEIEVPLGSKRGFQATGSEVFDLSSGDAVSHQRFSFELKPTELGTRAELAVSSSDLSTGAAFEVWINPGSRQSGVYLKRAAGDRSPWLYHTFDAACLSPGPNAVSVHFSATVRELRQMSATLERMIVRIAKR